MLDKLSVVRNVLAVTECSGNSLAGLADLAVGSVSNYLRGQQTPDADKLEKLYQTALAVEKLAALEIPVDWAKIAKIKPLVDRIANGGSVSVALVDPPEKTEPLFALFLNGAYFMNRRKDALDRWQVNSTRQPGSAAIFTKSDAEKLKNLLTSAGYRAQIVPSREEFADSLPDAWGEALGQ